MTSTRTDTERTQTDTSETNAETEGIERACPECGGQLITDEEHGETVCADCSLVVTEDEIDRGRGCHRIDLTP